MLKNLILFLFLQIVLESFPVSSGGHIFLLKKYFYFNFSNGLFEIFDHLAHGATILIILILFWSEWSRIIFRLVRIQLWRESYKRLFSIFFKIVRFVFVADLITAFFYFVIKILFKNVFWLQSNFIVLSGFLITMISLFSLIKLRSLNEKSGFVYENWNLRKAIVLGFVQGIALLPGISRFATTYVAGRWLNLSPRRSIQISFLIQFPLIVAAFLYALKKLFFGSPISLFSSTTSQFVVILVFMLFATILGYYALKFSRRLALGQKFWSFGFYMIIPIVATLVIIFKQVL